MHQSSAAVSGTLTYEYFVLDGAVLLLPSVPVVLQGQLPHHKRRVADEDICHNTTSASKYGYQCVYCVRSDICT